MKTVATVTMMVGLVMMMMVIVTIVMMGMTMRVIIRMAIK